MEKELRGGYVRTTNNRMELMGVIAALEELGSFREEQLVNILGNAKTLLQETPVVGYATKNHVEFQNVLSAQGEIGTLGKEFALT